VGPLQLWAPLLGAALLATGGLAAADEWLVGPAGRRVDEITIFRFHVWGDFRFNYGEVRWLRGKKHVYHLREGDPEKGFAGVTIYTLSDDFRLAARVDAARMEPLGGRRWRLVDGTERKLGLESSPMTLFAQRELELEESASTFQIAKGRPEQLGLMDLREQVRRRERLGLPAQRYRLALHNKFAYPLAGVPGGALAFALAARPGRRSFVISAVAEGFFLIVGLWALLVLCKASALAGYLSPAGAAWTPVALLCAAAVAGLWRFAR
jgi:lipopolysaccharide export system permease protein